MPELQLLICGAALRLSISENALWREARERYGPFAGGRGSALTLEVAGASGGPGPAGPEPRVARAPEGLRVSWRDFHLEFSGRRARAVGARGILSLDSALRVALSWLLFRRGGFLCHAAAVDGWLFPGRSGGGKSTLGRQVPLDRLLSDELAGVAGGRVHATPFWGNFRPGRGHEACTLEGIFFLDRRAPRGVLPVGKAEAMARLLRCVFFFGNDAASARAVAALAGRLVARVPAYTLSYNARAMGFDGVERMIREASG